MVPTNEKELSIIFSAAISGITPRLEYKRDEGWKPYERSVGSTTTTRRFRLRWFAGDVQPGGAFSGSAIEHYATLHVRTDYAGEHEQQQFIIADDFHQVGDTLSAQAGTANGLVLVTRERTVAVKGSIQDDDVVLVDHTYLIRFIRSIQL